MVFEDFIEQLFTSIKSSNGALTCFVYVDGEELLNTTCLFKDVLSDAVSCADRLSLAIDPVVGQAVRENKQYQQSRQHPQRVRIHPPHRTGPAYHRKYKSVSLMAVVSFGDNDEVYRFKHVDSDLVCNYSLNESKVYKEFVTQSNIVPTFEQMVTPSKERLKLMKQNGVTETKERYNKRVSIMKEIFSDKDIEIDDLFNLYDQYIETFF